MPVRTLVQLPVKGAAVTAKGADQRASVEIYRPFFLAGILCVLTAGCLLGAVALLGVSLSGSYTASVWTPYVLAHANSQLYGWVGFFVMGFALQQHAPTQRLSPLFHQLAAWSLGLLAVAIALRFTAEPMVAAGNRSWVVVGVFSGGLQTLAVALFIFNIAYTRHRPSTGLTWQTKFVFAALFWWLAAAVAEPFYFALSHQANKMASIQFVAEWFAPYREAQFLGFVAMMILGVALTKLNTCFGAKEAHKETGNAGFVLWNAGLVAKMAGWALYFESGMAAGSGLLYFIGGSVIAMAALLLVHSSRLFEPLSESNRSQKFIRAAFAWLIAAGFLVAFEPFYLEALGLPFSHAFTGAIRHALTVGFISQMIIGVSMHVIARMNDLDPARQKQLWSVFWLLNAGNALRVGCEIVTDVNPKAFSLMGVTGFIELTALVIWAFNVGMPMLRSAKPSHAS